MKISIEKNHLSKIAALREQLAALLNECDGNASELASLSERQGKLSAEISRLEVADDLSDSDASKLASRRVQLERITKKIGEANSGGMLADQLFANKVVEVLKPFAVASTAATAATVMEYVGKVAAAVRPYCESEAVAMSIASQTPAVASLKAATTRRWGTFGFTVMELRAAIAHADAILAGELAWNWDANLGDVTKS